MAKAKAVAEPAADADLGCEEPRIIDVLDSIGEAVLEAERLADAVEWKLLGPVPCDIAVDGSDAEDVAARMFVILDKLRGTNASLMRSAKTIGACE